MAVTAGALLWTVLAGLHYTDRNLAVQNYCHQNKFKKDTDGEKDFLDNNTTVCNSSIVLDYTVEQLETPLRAVYLAQTVTGALLTAAAPPALVGVLRGRRRPLLVWAAGDVIWGVTLLGSAAALAPFGFPVFVPMLVGSAAACLLFGLAASIAIYRKFGRLEHRAPAVQRADVAETAV